MDEEQDVTVSTIGEDTEGDREGVEEIEVDVGCCSLGAEGSLASQRSENPECQEGQEVEDQERKECQKGDYQDWE